MGKRMGASLPSGTKVPDHIAIIPDGNRRWARARGKDTLEGHKKGFDITTKIAKAAREMGVHTLSLWGFSTENWDRTKREIDYLMILYARLVDNHLSEAKRDKVRIIHLGRKDRLPERLMKKITRAEEETKNFTDHTMNICLDYGGRDEIVRAINRAHQLKMRTNDTSEITEENLVAGLDTFGQPYPYVDLLIRTSGEQRTSGLFLWQAAYAELYFELDHFPDFSPEKLREAVLDYSRRRRRFGGNDAEEHMVFDPKIVTKLEFGWRRALGDGKTERFRDLVIEYVKEHYGLSRDLAKTAGVNLAQALIYGKEENWDEAGKALKDLYEIIRKTLGLALEPEMVAKIEVDMWRGKDEKEGWKKEEMLRQWCAETFRVSGFQASKAAHLAALARAEINQAELKKGDASTKHWEKAKWYMERYYVALKERVA